MPLNAFQIPAMLALLAVLAAACVVDWRQRRIPNPLLLAGLGCALAWQAFAPAGSGLFDPLQPGAPGLLDALAALALMLAAGFTLWRLRLFGAGDAKLLAIVAAFFGPADVLPLLLGTVLAGGVLALGGWLIAMRPSRAAPGALRAAHPAAALPYALAVALGTAWVAALRLGGVLPF